jgi:hypothetical protein
MWLKALRSQQHEYTALPPQPSLTPRDRHDNVVIVIERRWTTLLRVVILALTGTVLAAAMFELGRRSTISPVWREVGRKSFMIVSFIHGPFAHRITQSGGTIG